MPIGAHFRVVLVCAAVLPLCSLSAAADELGTFLKQSSLHKVFVIRHFWQGNKLHYDSTGQIVGSATAGFWSTDGLVQVKKVRLSGTNLHLECQRLIAAASNKGLDYRDSLGLNSRTDISIDFGTGVPTIATAGIVLSKVFVSSTSEFLASVPEYWKPCIAAGLGRRTDEAQKRCQLAPRFLSTLGTSPLQSAAPSATLDASVNPGHTSSQERAWKVGPGVSPPKAIYAPDPQYSEEARSAKVNGSCVLSVVVDKNGMTTAINIVRPLGYGLDERSVESLKEWKFEPAKRGDQPVPVVLEVEMTFRLW